MMRSTSIEVHDEDSQDESLIGESEAEYYSSNLVCSKSLTLADIVIQLNSPSYLSSLIEQITVSKPIP